MIVNVNAAAMNDDRVRANRFDVVSSLADDLAHEIKNPLNSVLINLEVLKVRLARADTASALNRAQVIEEEVRRLHQLLDRLLMLLRPDRDEAAVVPLDSALDELIPLVETQARLSRNEFAYDCSASVFVTVRRDTLKFALLNLALASLERLGEGGGRLVLRCAPTDTTVTLTVEATARPGSLNPGAAAFDEAISMAAALLGDSGVRIDRTADGVSIILPRITGG